MEDEPCAIASTRVRYPETDRMGVAHHVHHFVWFEIGRTEYMRQAGCPYGRLEDEHGLFFPVTRASARYRSPARYDEELEIRTWLEHIGGARVVFRYEVTARDTRRAISQGSTEHAAVNREGRPTRIPQWLRQALSRRQVSS